MTYCIKERVKRKSNEKLKEELNPFQRKAGRFYPTRLALNLMNKKSVVKAIVTEEENNQDKCNIIVETNYRVSN